ncbi:MAG: hypothetical protein Q4E12_03825 [Coriobacteriia bacterium]|nr:hypothetical protein [Coriobacteriia bacterium]
MDNQLQPPEQPHTWPPAQPPADAQPSELPAAQPQAGPEGAFTFPSLNKPARWIIAALLVVVAAISFFAVADVVASPDFNQSSINALDEKRNNVMGLIASTAVASTAISAIPDDTGTPIAEKLADVSQNFGLILGAIYLEKYLLTLAPLATFKVLIPLALVGFAFCLLFARWAYAPSFRVLFGKVLVLGVALVLVVPLSVAIAQLVEDTYAVSLEETTASLDSATDQLEGAGASDSGDSSGNVIDWFTNTVTNAVDSVTTSASNLLGTMQNALSDAVEAFAVMVITSCVIPLLVILFFLWLINALFNVNIQVPIGGMKART